MITIPMIIGSISLKGKIVVGKIKSAFEDVVTIGWLLSSLVIYVT